MQTRNLNHSEILADSRKRADAILALLQEMHRYEPIPLSRSADAVEQSICNAINFFKQAMHTAGFWSDFAEIVGGGRDWVSGYVGYALQCSGAIDPQELQSVADLLLLDRYPSGGWGYCPGLPVDADSTSWATLFLQKRQLEWDKQKSVEILLGHQDQSTGGIPTYWGPQYGIAEYIGRSPQDDFSGWCSGHVCVSAAAAQALLACGLDRHHPSMDKLVSFLHATQQSDGHWNAYWFHSKTYATAHCVRALQQIGETPAAPVLQRAAHWLETTQLPDGSWNNGVEGSPGRVFDTALAVWGGVELCTSASFEKAVAWLLAQQRPDGSWDSLPILQFPPVNEQAPWDVQERHEFIGLPEIDWACVADHNRYFTTATALQALSAWYKRKSS